MSDTEGLRESMSFYPRGKVYAGKGHSTHIDQEYELVEDKTEDGVRTIVMREKDRSVLLEKAQKLVDVIANLIGEGESKATKAILFDEFKDYDGAHIDHIYKRITEKKEPVKTREGCYKIIIGDGRKKNSMEIMLRG